jgi:hypothetical protein
MDTATIFVVGFFMLLLGMALFKVLSAIFGFAWKYAGTIVIAILVFLFLGGS